MSIKSIRIISLGLFLIIVVLAISCPALGAEPKSQKGDEFRQKLESLITEEKKEKEEELPQEIDTYVRYMPSRGANKQSGKVGIIESESEYSYELKAFGKLPIEFSLTTQYIGIENTTRITLPPYLTGLSTGIEATLPFFKFDKTYLRIGISPSFFSDNWDFNSSNFRIPSRYFLIYQPDDKWTYILGVAVYPDFENEVFPIIGFIYKPNDKLTFNITPERPNIIYMINNRVGLFGEFDSANGEFEVTRNDSKNVILRYTEQHLGIGTLYKFNKFIQSSISVGGIFNRSLKYRDGEGKINIKNGLYTEFRVDMHF